MGDARSEWLVNEAWLEAVQGEEGKRRKVREKGVRRVDVNGLRSALDAWSKKTRKSSLTLVKESEKRKLRERLRHELSSEVRLLEMLVPSSKQSRLSYGKIDGRRDGVYCIGETALFIALDTNELVPTVAALRRCPVVLRQLAIFPPVLRNLARGADLFFPGLVGAASVAEISQKHTKWPEVLCGGAFARGEPVALVEKGDWRPVAVGFFALDSEDALLRGPTGTVVEILNVFEDALWQNFGTKDTDETQRKELPAYLFEALAETSAAASERADRITFLQAERAAAESAIAAAQALDQLRRDQRRLEKALRQINDLKSKSNPNADQRQKLERESSLRAELTATSARLDEMLNPPLQEAQTQAIDLEESTAASAVTQEEPEEIQEEAESNSNDDEEDDVVSITEALEDSKDDKFEAAFLTVAEQFFPLKGRPAKEPVLANELFGLTARRAGCSVKETRWKKAAKFLEDLDIVETRDRGNGVTQVVSIDWKRAPAFERIEAPLEDDDSITKLPKPKKRGGHVIVALRRIRNKNCTFVDNLDSWGYSDHELRDIATNFRSRFSASASVGPRKGTEDNKAGKVFLSIMVQGKYAAQIARTLKSELGISNISVQAPKGLISKRDLAANV